MLLCAMCMPHWDGRISCLGLGGQQTMTPWEEGLQADSLRIHDWHLQVAGWGRPLPAWDPGELPPVWGRERETNELDVVVTCEQGVP